MIGSSRACKVWACPAPVDLGKGFDGLAFIVKWQLGKEVLAGDCFLFTSRTRVLPMKMNRWPLSGSSWQRRLTSACRPS